MKWPPWSHRPPEPDTTPAVTDEQRADLEEARAFLASQNADFDAQLPEIRRVTTYIRREVGRNHLAEKFRVAFGGSADGQRH